MKIKYSFLFLILLFVSCSSNKHRYLVTSDTMRPTINPGDYIHEDSSIKTLTYGDMVSYHYKGGDSFNAYDDVFRIVGLPGDSIAVKDDICIINGKKSPHRFIRKNDIYDEIEEVLPNGLAICILYLKLESGSDDINTIKVPDNHYFVLGDSRTGSIDSRYFGAIPKDEIIGKVVKIIKAE